MLIRVVVKHTCALLGLLLLFTHTALLAQTQPLVVVVNEKNPVTSLSKKQVIDIYMGRFNTFPEGSPAQPIDFPSGTPTKQDFYAMLLGKSERKVAAYWSRLLFSGRATPPTTAASKEDVLDKIKNNQSAIAYLHPDDATPEMKIVYQF